MGEVYLAIQSGMGGFEKPLALKLLLPHLAERAPTVERFLAEAQVAAKMNHVNVAQIFDVGTADGRYFIAMELVRGVSLAVLIRALKAARQLLPVEVIAYVARSVCDGLHHAHALGVVHRDVTPHNVLVSVDGAVKLTDFGIARVDGDSRPGKLEGKAAYVAPELISGSAVDHRADLFSLGVSLYQLATLESPFRRDDDSRSLLAVARERWTPLAELRPDLDGPLATAIERASAKSPDDRFPDARAMREALPAPHADAADHLSKVVRSLCSRDLDALEARTKVLSSRPSEPGTLSLPADGRRRPRLAWLAPVAAVGLAVAVLAAWPDRRPEAPAPNPTPATAPGAPEAAPGPALAATAPATGRSEGARRPPARPPATGYVTINATPWAEVRVDGKLVGETPIARYPLDADGRQHEVELRNPETRRTVKRQVRLGAGQHAFVKVDLQ